LTTVAKTRRCQKEVVALQDPLDVAVCGARIVLAAEESSLGDVAVIATQQQRREEEKC
jgi:hypothetical protein